MFESTRHRQARTARPLFVIAIAAGLAAGSALAGAPPRAAPRKAPRALSLPVAALQRTLVFDAPAYLAASVEDTPYQRLRLCDAGGRSCRTLVDARGGGGVALPADPSLGLSPDGHYLLCFRMSGVDAASSSYRQQYDALYDLVTSRPATFTTDAGVTATTDNIQAWSAGHPHALEVSTAARKTSLALPAGEN